MSFLGGLFTAGTGILGSILGANAQSDAANQAAQFQEQAGQKQIGVENDQLQRVQGLFDPYQEAGKSALNSQLSFLGLGAPGSAQDAIKTVQQGPEYQSMTQAGENAILSNASATGGLRGGNVQASLAKFQPALLSQLLNQYYTRLGGITSNGLTASNQIGAFGQDVAHQIGGAYQGIGAAQAGNALAQGSADANMWGGIAKSLGGLFTPSNMSSLSSGMSSALAGAF